MAANNVHDEALLRRVQRDFIGLDTRYLLADGRSTRRVYLDSAATTLMLRGAHDVARQFLAHYANTHSRIHFSARAATECYAYARERVLSFVGADPGRYACLFIGNGATAPLNRAAGYLSTMRRDHDTVLVSLMEHHSNDLPHRRLSHVRHVPITGAAPALEGLDVDAFARLLRAERVRYAALGMVSNVTGIVTPIGRLTALARAEGVPVLVDASQAIAHMPVRMAELGEPEAVVFSGHKVYAPGSPGVLIIRREILESVEPAELGGGMVDRVTKADFAITGDLSEREEAGTPNIAGAVTLAAVLETLSRIGMEKVAEHEQGLAAHLLGSLGAVPGLRLYGAVDPDRCPRTGVASWNLDGLDHAFVAAVLNDYFNIAVRNECFCAHPYVRALISPELWALDVSDDAAEAEREVARRRGMVRASLGLYSTREDVDALIEGLRDLQANTDRYRREYRLDDKGNYRHMRFAPPPAFDIASAVDRMLAPPPDKAP